MKLVAGLGNPGSAYEKTRHNAGFMALKRLVEAHGAASWRTAFQAFVCDVSVGGQKLVLLQPITYMNNSGRSVLAAMQFYKLPLADLLVVVDDLALPCGSIRLRASGSAGGHNGLADVSRGLQKLAAEEGKTGDDYARLRIGIDQPGRVPQIQYVLEPFSAAQAAPLASALDQAADAITCWAEYGIETAMNRFNRREAPSERGL